MLLYLVQVDGYSRAQSLRVAMAHISIYKIVRKMSLCYLVQVDDILVLYLCVDDG